jgi:hypothetical protein
MDKLWSHSIAQQPTAASADELDALSRRYSQAAVIVLPLASGNFAVFGNDRQLISIVFEDQANALYTEIIAASIKGIRDQLQHAAAAITNSTASNPVTPAAFSGLKLSKKEPSS